MDVIRILYFSLPNEILCRIFSRYLSIQDISLFDIAICNHRNRPAFLEYVGSVACIWLGDKERQLSYKEISWMYSRKIKVRNLNCDTVNDNTAFRIAGCGVCLEWLTINKQYLYDSGMIQIAENCPNIRHLDISRCNNITDYSIIKIAEYCPNIDYLNIAECRVTDKSVVRIVELCHELETLNIAYCHNITDLCISKIAEYCPQMTSLDVTDNSIITDLSMIKLAECCNNLEILNISFCRNITDTSMRKVAEYCLNMKHLSTIFCNRITDLSIVLIAESCRNIGMCVYMCVNLKMYLYL